MADQARWFKLWVSAPADDDIQRMEPAQRWAWAAFGCYTKLHGTHGMVRVSPLNAVLAAEMGVPVSELILTLKLLPHLDVLETENRHGELAVTWHNWTKYQEDSTVAERQKASRSKKRRDEMRRDEKRLTPPIVPPPGGPEVEILTWLNQKAGKNFRPKETNLALIRARLKDGVESYQLKAIISRKVREWQGTEQAKYLRPATLFNKTKCEQYLGDLPPASPDGDTN